jgi:hypothetical protein
MDTIMSSMDYKAFHKVMVRRALRDGAENKGPDNSFSGK